MFASICRILCQIRRSGDIITKTHFPVVQNSSLKFISTTSTPEPSFTFSYLINSCGFSEQAAITASQRVQLNTSERPDSVLSLFRDHGFNDIQTSKLITKCPSLLLANPEKTLKPKLEFFHSKGFSPTDLAMVLSSDSTLLNLSLENKIVPSFEFLKNIVQTDQNVVKILRRSTRILYYMQKCMLPNILILRDHGMPEPLIVMLLVDYPRTFVQTTDHFRKIVEEIIEIGIEPFKPNFVRAIRSRMVMSKSTWERKFEVCRSWGWSEDEIFSAFRKQPVFMTVSEKKMMKVMDFLVNTMGLESSVIARCPQALMCSLEKRTIPRCSVIQVLQSKDLIDNNFSIATVLGSNEEYFLKKFVTKYQDEVPELLKVYQGEMD